jgi:hypothetical protein
MREEEREREEGGRGKMARDQPGKLSGLCYLSYTFRDEQL